jgi:hypothetical protein
MGSSGTKHSTNSEYDYDDANGALAPSLVVFPLTRTPILDNLVLVFFEICDSEDTFVEDETERIYAFGIKDYVHKSRATAEASALVRRQGTHSCGNWMTVLQKMLHRRNLTDTLLLLEAETMRNGTRTMRLLPYASQTDSYVAVRLLTCASKSS